MEICECGHTKDMHTDIGCLDFEDLDDPKNYEPCGCMKFKLRLTGGQRK